MTAWDRSGSEGCGTINYVNFEMITMAANYHVDISIAADEVITFLSLFFALDNT